MVKHVCTAAQMREIDKIAAQKFNIPGIVLMENAALACVREISGYNSFAVICGKGNNGGDGLAIARHLINMGKTVKIYLVLGENFSGDALTNYNILKSMGVPFNTDFSELETDLRLCDYTVDALFGTGIHGEITGAARDVIEKINRRAKYVLSVDVPSGVNSDTGEADIAVKADKTVTFAAYKRGLLLFPGADYAGEVVCSDISVPEQAFDTENVRVKVLTEEYLAEIMPKRRANSHKGDYGKIFVIGGSVGMAGAVIMACEAAFRTGAGIVTACVPSEINDIVQTSLAQAMTFPVDFEKDAEKIVEKMAGFDTILFGNGIGRGKYVPALLEKILESADVPVVIDADGLFALAGNMQILKRCKSDVILTPHTMEMARLTGKDAKTVENDRFSAACGLVSEYRLTLVLKGNHSIITAPDGEQSVNMTGNAGMATAGSGDVLAGMTAALAARGLPPYHAAELAVYLHGAAGDAAKMIWSEESLTARDIISCISQKLPVENQHEI